MTDADGFYRPRGLPQDIEFEDDDDDLKNSVTESSSVSVYTSYSRPSSEASYLFPDRHVGRRTPVSMSDYNYNNVYTPPPPPVSHYTPPSPEYTPPGSTYTPLSSTYTPPSSTHTVPVSPLPPARPLLPSDHTCCSRYGTTIANTPVLPITIHDPPFPRHRHCCSNRKFSAKARKIAVRTTLLALLCAVLWNVYLLFAAPMPPPLLPSFCALSKTAFATQGIYSLDLPASSFTFIETADVGLDGNVVVLTDPDALNVTVEYDIVSSAPDTVSFSVDDDEGVVRLRAPHTRECVTAHITLTLPSTLQSLSITTSTLPIELRDSVTLSTLAVSTSHGSLISHASVNSTTSVSLRSGSISGTFDLAEQLTLKTLAGSISAKIHPLNLTTPNAKLTAKTLSGSISLGLKLDDHTPPRRNYSTEVQTVSGSISGLYLFGATTTFAADAGAISVSVLPTLYEERFDTLVTSSQHGATVLGFEKALKGKKVYGIHGTVTGGVEVKYPKDWEGKVIAKAGVGVVDVVGEGIEITRREIGLVEGFKGNKTNGKIVAGSGVGGVLVRVG